MVGTSSASVDIFFILLDEKIRQYMLISSEYTSREREKERERERERERG